MSDQRLTLITGINGLLGANVAQVLIESGYRVRGLVRPTANLAGIEDLDIDLVTGQLTDDSDLEKAMHGVRYVVHSAANVSHWSPSYQDYDINTVGTERIIEACLNSNVERLVHVGTANSFGLSGPQNPADENGSWDPRQDGSPYMVTKRLAQEMVLEAVDKQGLRAVVVNPTNMIGARDAGPSSGLILQIALRNQLFGRHFSAQTPTVLNFVHVLDVAQGVRAALEKGNLGECYILANQNLSYQHFFNLIEEVVGFRIHRLKIPGVLVTLLGWIGQGLELLVRRPLALNRTNALSLVEGRCYTAAKAVRELGLPQTPIVEAIREAIDWFEERGYL